MRFKSLVALVLLALMLLTPLTTSLAQGDAAVKASDDKIVVNFDKHGPMSGLRKLGTVDPRLVYALQDAKGNLLNPTKVRRIDGPLYLPKDAKLDMAAYRKFLWAELKAYGHRRRHRHGNKGVSKETAVVIPQVHIPEITVSGPSKVLLQPAEKQDLTYTVYADNVLQKTSITEVSAAKPEPVIAPFAWKAAVEWVVVGALLGILLFALGYFVYRKAAPRVQTWKKERKVKKETATDTGPSDFRGRGETPPTHRSTRIVTSESEAAGEA